ncbi:MAG: hypothetical protein JSV81_01405 [Anaerolineales bacterium]|nr:MAG: hypothetical protein JSV81_01405 [Anaerolineales bacterium]
MADRRTRPLIIGAIAVIVLLILRLVLPKLLPPEAGQTASFITVFLAILMAFIFFGVVFVSALLSGKIGHRLYGVIEKIIIAGILLGVVGMFQPWTHLAYRIGFHVLLFSLLSFIVWSHISPQAASYEEEVIANVTVNEPAGK